MAVTSLLLGSGLKDLISSDVQPDPNNPADPAAQMEYNMAAIQVGTHPAALLHALHTCCTIMLWLTVPNADG